MKKMRQFLKGAKAKVGAIAFGTFGATGMALADSGDLLTDVSINADPVFSMANLILIAIASIWAIKKLIALGNKS